MPYNTVSLADRLSIPLGVIIGPCTVLSNLGRVIYDIAQMIFLKCSMLNYVPSDAYNNDCPAEFSAEDRSLKVLEEKLKTTQEACLKHLTFIGIGVIRTIPIIGGVARCAYVRRVAINQAVKFNNKF